MKTDAEAAREETAKPEAVDDRVLKECVTDLYVARNAWLQASKAADGSGVGTEQVKSYLEAISEQISDMLKDHAPKVKKSLEFQCPTFTERVRLVAGGDDKGPNWWGECEGIGDINDEKCSQRIRFPKQNCRYEAIPKRVYESI